VGVTSDVPRLIFLSNLSALKASVIPGDGVSTNVLGDEVFFPAPFPLCSGERSMEYESYVPRMACFCAKEAID
jgi:hypothetical protein